MIANAITNLVLNIVLGKIIGVEGVVVATITSLLFFGVVSGIYLIYKYYFTNYRLHDYYRDQLFYFFITILSCLVCHAVFNSLYIDSIADFVIKGFLCALISCLIMFFAYFRTKNFKDAVEFVKVHLFRG